MNPHRVLLTCFGGKIAFDVVKDFERRNDVELFVADANAHAPVSAIAQRFLCLPRGDDPAFAEACLEAVRRNAIEMIIPGGDEDALALMASKELFDAIGVTVAVQDHAYLPVFQSKRNQFEYLVRNGFSVPAYRCARTREECIRALDELGYPDRSILVKPSTGRGGSGVLVVSEQLEDTRDHLCIVSREQMVQRFKEGCDFMFMEYLDGTVYDIDVLKYASGDLFFGQRRRLGTNITKQFSGNRFDQNERLEAMCRALYRAFPTTYLVDYDVIMTDDGEVHLLEINPRPSGSTISYLPFGVNLYYILLKSYLDGEQMNIDMATLAGHSAHAFYTMGAAVV